MNDKKEHGEHGPVTITDKRGKAKPVEQGVKQTPEEIEEANEFQRQQTEEQARLAEWEGMSDEEKQEILARQAAANEGIPYAGAGVQNEGAQKKAIMAAFVVVIDVDGTSLATDNLDTSGYDIQRPVTPPMMYRACAEIMKDVQSGETALHVLRMMAQQGQAMQQQQHAAQLQAQLAKRGIRTN